MKFARIALALPVIALSACAPKAIDAVPEPTIVKPTQAELAAAGLLPALPAQKEETQLVILRAFTMLDWFSSKMSEVAPGVVYPGAAWGPVYFQNGRAIQLNTDLYTGKKATINPNLAYCALSMDGLEPVDVDIRAGIKIPLHAVPVEEHEINETHLVLDLPDSDANEMKLNFLHCYHHQSADGALTDQELVKISGGVLSLQKTIKK